MTDNRDNAGRKDKAALARLRAENNLLKRRLQEMEARLAGERRRREAQVGNLRRELEGIKNSRVWRTALRLRRIWPERNARADGGANRVDGTDRRAGQYEKYLAAHEMTDRRREALLARVRELTGKPLVSIVLPVHNTDPELLGRAVGSVLEQIYDRWELCIVDDATARQETLDRLDAISHPRVRVKRLDEHRDIAAATNEAIGLASGDYIAFLDHDDELAPDALVEVVSTINDSDADFIYTDEDYLDGGNNRINPHFKPDYSPELLLSHNYMTHLVVVRRALVERLGGLRSEFDGAQDYDFVLRAVENARVIRHVPKVLYHWRMSEGSTSMNAQSKPHTFERGRQALQDALRRRGCGDAEVTTGEVPNFYRVRYPIREEPLVSIVIPFRDKPELLHCIVGDILDKSTYGRFEIVGVNNDSAEDATYEAMEDLAALDERVRFLEYPRPFSFAAIVNFAAGKCAGGHLVLLNNDIRMVSPGWIEALLEHSQRAEVGAVGGKLLYPDDRVQHAGIIVGIDGYAGHSHKGFAAGHQGYFNRLQVVQNVSALTGAFMMVKKELFDAVGGFDEESFAIACNDVDFCLRLLEQGYWNVFTPFAVAYHRESASRGYEDTPEKKQRFAREKELFQARHAAFLERGDPFYNPNLTVTAEDFSFREDFPEDA